jgi:uncharacterized protein (DUF4415 family)
VVRRGTLAASKKVPGGAALAIATSVTRAILPPAVPAGNSSSRPAGASLTDAQLRNAVRGRFYKPLKRQITARVDADVLQWLKSQGRGYQSRLNAILRREILSSLK